MTTRLGLLLTLTATVGAISVVGPLNTTAGAGLAAGAWALWAWYLWHRSGVRVAPNAPDAAPGREFWDALVRACALAGRRNIPVALLLLRSPNRDGMLEAVHRHLRTADMAAATPKGDVAVLLHDSTDEGAHLFVERVRASFDGPLSFGYAWARGDSGPRGLHLVASQMLDANARRLTPAAKAS
jgi:hypothetical protein